MPTRASRLRASEASGSEDFQDALDANDARSRLQASNDLLERKMDQLKVNSNRLQREISLLRRHIGTLKQPAFEIWEADVLTRLIEVAFAFAHQRIKLPARPTAQTEEALNQVYVNASRQVHEGTLRRLGLDPKYGKALLRYHEIVQYRSRDPSQTEFQFARWLVRQKVDRPEKFAFWAKLFPICYDRTVEQSAAL